MHSAQHSGRHVNMPETYNRKSDQGLAMWLRRLGVIGLCLQQAINNTKKD
jgi:hypothetical protein